MWERTIKPKCKLALYTPECILHHQNTLWQKIKKRMRKSSIRASADGESTGSVAVTFIRVQPYESNDFSLTLTTVSQFLFVDEDFKSVIHSSPTLTTLSHVFLHSKRSAVVLLHVLFSTHSRKTNTVQVCVQHGARRPPHMLHWYLFDCLYGHTTQCNAILTILNTTQNLEQEFQQKET